jgi:hypothetical protein
MQKEPEWGSRSGLDAAAKSLRDDTRTAVAQPTSPHPVTSKCLSVSQAEEAETVQNPRLSQRWL